jgi:hypothetical protein
MTVGNVRHWAENCRNPDLKWVMPIHGRTIQEAELWWNALKQTGAPFDGIAIGGALGFDLSLILGVLVHIHQEGRLAACRLIHIFGHFSVNYFLTLSILQKVLNEHVNPDIRVTFDASSPFWDAEHGNICHMKAGDEKVPFILRKEKAVDFFFPDNIAIVFPAMSKVMAGINIQDICVKKGSLHTHDHLSYMLIGLHNLEVSLDAFSSAHSLIYSQIVFDELCQMLIKKKLACGPIFDLLSTVRSIFTSKDPRLEIHANKKFLSSYL